MGVGISVVQAEAPSARRRRNGDRPTGCWTRLPFLRAGNGPPPSRSKSKVDAALSVVPVPTARVGVYGEIKSKNDHLQDRPVELVASCSTTTSSAESTSTNSIIGEELKVSFQLRKFTYSELKCATRNFRPETLLGEGGFGRVYKGWIEESGTAPVRPGTGLTVAVKTLNPDGLQGHKEWVAEVNFLGNLQHQHLVKLIGYCIEDNQRQLVYEFMSRGSLEHHLFRRTSPLPWSTRLKIALGAAKGLAFLHEETGKPVIFRDFKTSNVLLDAGFNAKLSDFGLAKDGPEGDKTHVSTRVMGTYGYAAPEYVMTGHLTSKSDVYSFGVVLLELMTGRKSMDKNRPDGDRNLVEWACPYLKDRLKLYKIMDPRLGGNFSVKGAQRVAQLAHACVTRNPKARPLMSKVVEALEPLPNLKDLAATSGLFQVQTEHASMKAQAQAQSSSARNGQQPARSLSYGPPFRTAFHASPFGDASHASPYRQSPRSNAK